jgi:hypothetical protein
MSPMDTDMVLAKDIMSRASKRRGHYLAFGR